MTFRSQLKQTPPTSRPSSSNAQMQHYEHPVPEVKSLLDLVQRFEADSLTWWHRSVHASFNDSADMWVGLYWSIHGDPYFDAGYQERIDPKRRLAELFAKYPDCELIDWSPGRLLCIQAHGANAAQFCEIVLDTVTALHGPVGSQFRASFEEAKAAG